MWQGDYEDQMYSDKFIRLTKKMTEVMADFCVNALYAFRRRKGSPLDQIQIDQMIDFELQAIIEQFQDSEILELVKKTAYMNFCENNPFNLIDK